MHCSLQEEVEAHDLRSPVYLEGDSVSSNLRKVQSGDPLWIPLAACVEKIYGDRDFSHLGVGV